VLENDLLELVWKMNFSGYPLSFNSCTTRFFSCCFLLSVEGMLSARSHSPPQSQLYRIVGIM
jgi:hypothetical protein